MIEIKHVCDLCALGITESELCYVGVRKCKKNGVYSCFRNREAEEKEKALDKACERLEIEHRYESDGLQTKEDWKEWCLDESYKKTSSS